MYQTPIPVLIPTPAAQVIPSAENLFKMVLLLALLFGSFALTQQAVNALAASGLPGGVTTALTAVLILGMAVWNGIIIVGFAVLAHEAVHKVLFRSLFWNEFWGGLAAAFALIPFYANRQFHFTHHSYAHQPQLDPENAMHNHPFVYAFTVGSINGLNLQYGIFLRNLLRMRDRRFTARVVKDACFVAVAGLAYFGLTPALGISLWYTVVPTLLVFPLVFAWRALSDHYAVPAIERATLNPEDMDEADEEAWHRDREKRKREVSGWVVLTHPWLEWLWSHVNYHEVHHKYPWLSHHHLPQVFAATRDTQPYLQVKGYWRSLFNLRRLPYYATRAQMQAFLTTGHW